MRTHVKFVQVRGDSLVYGSSRKHIILESVIKIEHDGTRREVRCRAWSLATTPHAPTRERTRALHRAGARARESAEKAAGPAVPRPQGGCERGPASRIRRRLPELVGPRPLSSLPERRRRARATFRGG
eukprot:4860887-Prymnesium_polylepis.1